MCGRYQFTVEQCEEIRRIADAIQRKYGDGAWSPGEIRPCSHAPVLMKDGDGEAPMLMKWGYQLPGTLVINARSETALEKPLFRESVRSRRCLIPSTGFYEWDSQKRKYLFTLTGEGALYMAGLYDRRGNKDCYCILTTATRSTAGFRTILLQGRSLQRGRRSWCVYLQRHRSACGRTVRQGRNCFQANIKRPPVLWDRRPLTVMGFEC